MMTDDSFFTPVTRVHTYVCVRLLSPPGNRSIAAATGAHYVHPFDDADAWKGHSSVVHELYRQLPQKPDAIVVSVGGECM